jgi:hypothetical protein
VVGAAAGALVGDVGVAAGPHAARIERLAVASRVRRSTARLLHSWTLWFELYSSCPTEIPQAGTGAPYYSASARLGNTRVLQAKADFAS